MDGMKQAPKNVIIVLAIMAFFCLAVNSHCEAAAEKKVLAFGDSLTTGPGIPYEKAFPAQLESRLRAQGYAVKVINAGVSGETSSGGLARLEWILQQHNPDFVILELGANDMLRAVDPALTRDNLDKMLDILKKKKIPVLLAGMKAFINMGPKYTADFDGIYPLLAKKYDALYYPFFLEGVALHSPLMREDGLHPNEAGAGVIADKILPFVEELIKKSPAAQK
jgi:acyl-CoA thioesterase-1